MYYGVPSDHIVVLDEPHDCDFFKAPIGSKGCHFEKSVAVTKIGNDIQTGRPTVSHDNGKTWEWDDFNTTRSVPSVWVSYTKVIY